MKSLRSLPSSSRLRPLASGFRPLLSGLCLLASAFTASAQVAKNAVRQSVDGIDLVVIKTGVQDIVTIRGSMAAGDSLSPDTNPAIADLTGGMLDKGTTKHDKFAISQMLGDVGATISFNVGPSTLNINGKCLKKDLPLVIGLISEQLRSPAFAPQEFEKLKRQVAGQMQRALEDTDFRSSDTFSRSIYPVGHPNRQPAVPEFLDGAKRATIDDVKAFYAKYYGPATLRLVLVGDIDAPAAQAEFARDFNGWTGGQVPPKPAVASGVDAAKDQTVFMADKTNVSVVWGQSTGLRYGDNDTLALRVGTAVLGSGFTGRLMANVRDKEGLTYGIGSFVADDTFVDGDWRISANFAPQLLDKGVESTRKQLKDWYSNGVTPAEVKTHAANLAGAWKVGLSTTSGMATVVLNTLNRDLDLSFVDQYPDRVTSLSADQINAAIKKHLDPDKMVLIKAGTVLDTSVKQK